MEHAAQVKGNLFGGTALKKKFPLQENFWSHGTEPAWSLVSMLAHFQKIPIQVAQAFKGDLMLF